MAYLIQYGPPVRSEAEWSAGCRKARWWIVAVLCIVGILAAAFLGPESLQNYLIPGDPDVTKKAFAHFTEDVRHGTKVREALTAFCREIIANADIS